MRLRRLAVVAVGLVVACSEPVGPVEATASACAVIAIFPQCQLQVLTPDPVLVLPGDSVVFRARLITSGGQPISRTWVLVALAPEFINSQSVADSVQTDSRGEVSYRLRVPTRVAYERYVVRFTMNTAFIPVVSPTIPVVIARSPSIALDLADGAIRDTIELLVGEPRTLALSGVDRFGNRQRFQGNVSVELGATASATCDAFAVDRYALFGCGVRLAVQDTGPKRLTLTEGTVTAQFVLRAVPRWTREVLGGDAASFIGTDRGTVVALESQSGRMRVVTIDGANVVRTAWLSIPLTSFTATARRGVVAVAWDTSRTGTGPLEVWRAPYGGTFERVPSPPVGVPRQGIAVDDSGRVIGGLPDGQVLLWNGTTWAPMVPSAPASWVNPPFAARVVGTLLATTAGIWRVGTLLDGNNTMATPRVAFATNGRWIGVDTAVSTMLAVSSVARVGDDLVVTRRRLTTLGLTSGPASFDATAVRYSGLGQQAALPEFPRGPTGVLPLDAQAHASVDATPVVQLSGPGYTSDPWRLVSGRWARISGWEANSAVVVGSNASWEARAPVVWIDASTFIAISRAGLVRYRLP